LANSSDVDDYWYTNLELTSIFYAVSKIEFHLGRGISGVVRENGMLIILNYSTGQGIYAQISRYGPIFISEGPNFVAPRHLSHFSTISYGLHCRDQIPLALLLQVQLTVDPEDTEYDFLGHTDIWVNFESKSSW
jgi:hypothetical protein